MQYYMHIINFFLDVCFIECHQTTNIYKWQFMLFKFLRVLNLL